MKNKNIKNKILQAAIIGLIMAAVAVLIWSVSRIYEINNDYKTTDEEYKKIRANAIVTKEEAETAEEKGYEYKEIDWEYLKGINPDIVGWIYIPDTPVDYPIVQGETDDEYLRTSFEGKRTSGGCIFMESANSSDFSDENTILYGHNMRNGSMFSCLKNFADKEFFDEHPIIQIYTPEWSRTYKVCSVHTDDKSGNSYKISFNEEGSYKNWLNDMEKRTALKGQEFSEYRKTITLSVCHGKTGTPNRMILNIQVADNMKQQLKKTK